MNTERTIELKDHQMHYLEEMAKKHDLPDVSKAVRCLINFAVANENLESKIFDEIRCMDC